MSANVSTTFETLWRKEAKLEFDQMTSRLREGCTVVTGVNAGTYNFPRVGHGTATRNKARHADLQPMNVSHANASATITPVHATEYLDDLDMVRNNQNVRDSYTKAVVSAVNRDLDDLIITALSATTNSALSISNTLNKAGLISVNKTFLSNKIDPDGQWFAAISPGGVEDILGDTTLTSRDYVQDSMLNDGIAKGVVGFHLIPSTRLDSDTGSKTNNYFWHKSAVGLAIAKDLTFSVDWIPHKDSFQISAKLAAGAVIIEQAGVQFAEIDD